MIQYITIHVYTYYDHTHKRTYSAFTTNDNGNSIYAPYNLKITAKILNTSTSTRDKILHISNLYVGQQDIYNTWTISTKFVDRSMIRHSVKWYKTTFCAERPERRVYRSTNLHKCWNNGALTWYWWTKSTIYDQMMVFQCEVVLKYLMIMALLYKF